MVLSPKALPEKAGLGSYYQCWESWQPLKVVSSLSFPMEGDPGVLRLEKQIGRCLGLLQVRRQYGARIRGIRVCFNNLASRGETASLKDNNLTFIILQGGFTG